MITAQDELERFMDRRARSFEQAMLRIVRARFLNRADYDDALWALAEAIRETLILSDLHGRKRMIMEADSLRRAGSFSASPIANIPFEEAVENLVTREPRLAKGAAEVARLYNTEHVFAMARSASQKLTDRVQEAITKLIAEGKTTYETEAEIMKAAIEESHDWTQSYAATVYRTNLSNAYSAGRMEQAKDPDVADIVPALEFVSQDDARVRPNHAAAHGLVAATDDPIWNTYRPPIGYNCRCILEHVSIYELESRGLIKDGRVIRYLPPGFANAHPDGPPFSVGRQAW